MGACATSRLRVEPQAGRRRSFAGSPPEGKGLSLAGSAVLGIREGKEAKLRQVSMIVLQ